MVAFERFKFSRIVKNWEDIRKTVFRMVARRPKILNEKFRRRAI